MKTKKEISKLLEDGYLESLKKYIVTDGTKKDTVDALYLLFKKNSDTYEVTFESLPYSKGGRYLRHRTTLFSIQRWEIIGDTNGFRIYCSSTSKSLNCPRVIVPMFYTEKGKTFYNSKIENEIKKLKEKLLK